jgi:hypothetical protein
MDGPRLMLYPMFGYRQNLYWIEEKGRKGEHEPTNQKSAIFYFDLISLSIWIK